MKQTILLVSLLLAAGLLMAALQGCKGPEGPAGPPGESKILQLEGFAANINCGSCHNPDQDTTYFVWSRKYEWAASKHAYGGDYERAGSNCAECHTTEGFIEKSSQRTVTPAVYPSPPGCFACHSPHSRGNFSLRTVAPDTLLSGITGVSNAVFNFGKGNLCAACHRPRSMSSPKPDPTKTAATDTISITSSRWYQHYGVQSQILMGTGGFKWTDYTYSGNSAHTTAPLLQAEGCVQCHMATPPSSSTEFGYAGGHSMNIGYDAGVLLEGCKNAACHPTITTTDYHNVQTTVAAYLDTLQTIMADSAAVDRFNASSARKAWIVIGTSGPSINASASKPLKIVPASRAGALFNFFLVEHDQSEGVHNSVYVIDLLKSAVAELRKP